MTRKALLPTITECVDPEPESFPLNRGQLLQAVFPCAVVAALCVAHIHLQFVRTDMGIQHSQLQVRHKLLLAERARLEGSKEAMCGTGRLKASAFQDWGMQELRNPKQRVVAEIPELVRLKYSAPLPADNAPGSTLVADALTAKRGGRLQGMVFSLFDTGKAFASATGANSPKGF